MFLIVALGNIGKQYDNNRHNAGFLAIEHILNKIEYQEIKKASFLGLLYKTSDMLFLKPSTLMNASGQSVTQVSSFYKIPSESIIVVYDDLDLSFGSLKFRIGGRDAGHNGLKSINNFIKNDYKKIKIGIGRPEHRGQVESYVLGDFEKEQLKYLKDKIFINIHNAIDDINSLSFEKISSKYSLS
jgi:PTH1 family peptidyl-tRNA hydrolase